MGSKYPCPKCGQTQNVLGVFTRGRRYCGACQEYFDLPKRSAKVEVPRRLSAVAEGAPNAGVKGGCLVFLQDVIESLLTGRITDDELVSIELAPTFVESEEEVRWVVRVHILDWEVFQRFVSTIALPKHPTFPPNAHITESIVFAHAAGPVEVLYCR